MKKGSDTLNTESRDNVGRKIPINDSEVTQVDVTWTTQDNFKDSREKGNISKVIRITGKICSALMVVFGIILAFIIYIWSYEKYHGFLFWVLLPIFFYFPLVSMGLSIWKPDLKRIQRGRRSSVFWVFDMGFMYMAFRFALGLAHSAQSGISLGWLAPLYGFTLVCTIVVIILLWMPVKRKEVQNG